MSDRNASADTIASMPAIMKLAEHYELAPTHFLQTVRKIAMPSTHTNEELVACCLVAREHGLNPLTKEIYFMKTRGGSIQPIVSVDGWARKCNEHPQFDGMKFTYELDGNGGPISATCIIYRKDRKHPTEATEFLDECTGGGGPVWKSHPKRMLRHRALTQAARYAFGFAGVMDRDEFDQWQAMRDVTPAKATLPEIPDFDAVDEPPSTEPTTAVDPDGLYDAIDTALAACGDAAILAEVWNQNEIDVEALDRSSRQRFYDLYSKHEKRIEVAA